MSEKNELKQIIPMEPTLEYPDDIYFLQGFGEKHFTNELEAVMFHEYMRQYQDDLGWLHMEHIKTKKPFSLTAENIGSVFPLESMFHPEDFAKDILSMLTVRSYADKLSKEVGNTREAYYTIIFVMDDKVTFNIGNTCKYVEWDEIIDHLFYTSWEIHSDEHHPGIWHKRGLRKAFVLLTNVDDFRPIYTLYHDVAAGFIVDREHNDLTIFDPLSAIFIHHELVHLCEQQTTYWYGDDGHSGPERYYDDSMLEASQNPYVVRFRKLLEQYRTGFDIEQAIKRYDRN